MRKKTKIEIQRIDNPNYKADAKVIIKENKFENFRERLRKGLKKGKIITEKNSRRDDKVRESR